MTTENDIQHALDIARRLIAGGVPVFSAPPVPGQEGHYHLPSKWQLTVPSTVWLDKWEPGWGLAAVGGHVCDFLDGDPRNGGEDSLRQLHEMDIWPVTFGQQKTPSGGDHWIIATTGLRKATGEIGGFLPGLDLQSGDAAGVGRGFVWIAPTVRPSKVTGELSAYRWEVEPDLDLLKEQHVDADDSVNGLRELINGNRARRAPAERERIEVKPRDPDDPFYSASEIGRLHTDRSFTLTEAQDFVRPYLLDLQAAKVGTIEETANRAAAVLSHFVPEFWGAGEAFGLLEASLAKTAYDPNGPSDWTAEKFRAVLDGGRPPADAWKATRKPEPASTSEVRVEVEPGEETLSVYERLRRRLVTADDLAEQEPPAPLVHGLLNLDTESWLIGEPGSFKSFVALDLAGHVASGQEWQGHRVEQAGVLYLAAEGAAGMVLRTRAYRKEHGGMPGVTVLPYPVQVKSNDGQWDALVRIAREDRPGLIVVDTQARVSVGMKENDATEMGEVIAAIGRLRRATGACVLVVHHTGRDGLNARGSSAIDGAQDTELKLTRAKPRSSMLVKLGQDKQKDMSEGSEDGITLQLKVVELGTDPRNGKPLSSLVVRRELAPFAGEQGFTELDVDLAVWDEIPVPQPWTRALIPNGGKFKCRALQVLADHGHLRGLTSAETYRIVVDRWKETPAKGKGYWDGAWADLTALPEVVETGSARYGLDQAALDELRNRDI